MRIYNMTATFGCLEHETLTLQPGLNVLCRPNEWGKSTWCAFLLAMFYGLDTRTKSTKNFLAEKEHYAPWSGIPMSGRIDLNWNGRDITLERITKGRVPMGEQRAYETASGLDVPELEDGQWGKTILGAERSVFACAGFIRFTDLPVTGDEALRRRLNQLVTTGDESGEADRLSDALRDLKNRCRYNQSGLIPRVQAQKAELEQKLQELKSLEQARQQLCKRREELESRVDDLQNHMQTLRFRSAAEDAAKVEQAQAEYNRGLAQAEALAQQCEALPTRELTYRTLKGLQQLSQKWNTLQLDAATLPPVPDQPEAPACFAGKSPKEALQQVQADTEDWNAATAHYRILPLLFGVAAFGAGALLWLQSGSAVAGPIFVGAGALLSIWGLLLLRRRSNLRDMLESRYHTAEPGAWQGLAQVYNENVRNWEAEAARRSTAQETLKQRFNAFHQEQDTLCGGRTPEAWQQAAALWKQLDETRRDNLVLQRHLQTLTDMADRVNPPERPDVLQYTREETNGMLSQTQSLLRQVQTLLGQCDGKQETLGSAETLTGMLAEVTARLQKLEQFRSAVELAQQSLADASAELQRRFAPEIVRNARENLSVMTEGRYRLLTLDNDFSLNVGMEQEGVTRPILWQSDGTMDQLYLALRLAVAEVLTPDAPIVLDDALIRFDDSRLTAAMKLLQSLSRNRQILLFSCQNREMQLTTAI